MSYKWMTPELKNVHRRMKREYWKNKKSEKWFNIYILFFINEKKTESLPKNYSRQRSCWIYKCTGVL